MINEMKADLQQLIIEILISDIEKLKEDKDNEK